MFCWQGIPYAQYFLENSLKLEVTKIFTDKNLNTDSQMTELNMNLISKLFKVLTLSITSLKKKNPS